MPPGHHFPGIIDQQNGVAHDYSRQGNEADHGCRRELLAHDGMAGNDADQRQRDRRNDDGRHDEIAELPDDEHVDQYQRGHEGAAHVAEGLPRHGPLAGPFPGRPGRVFRYSVPGEVRLDAIRRRVTIDPVEDVEDAVHRSGQRAGHLAGNELDRPEVLVIDDGILRHPDEPAQLGQRNGTARRGWYRQLIELAQLRTLRERYLHDDITWFQDVLDLDITELEITHGHVQVAIDGLDADAPAHGLLAVDLEAPDVVGLGHQGVDIGDVLGLLEHLFHIMGELPARGVIRAIDFRDHGLQHRRSGRHFHDLDAGAQLLRQRHQDLARLLGQFVTGLVALGLVKQFHLDIGLPGFHAQIAVTHQAVEVER